MRCPTIGELPAPPTNQTGWPWTEEHSQLPDATPDNHPWPKVTIVTPSYNQGQFLEMTIRSVLLQGYPDLEFIIIDGGSSDNSVKIIRKYESWLAYWVSEKDQGQSNAINKGFTHATGDIFAYLNSDDFYEPGALQVCALCFGAGHEWVVGHVWCWHKDDGYLPFPVVPGKNITRWFLCCPVAQAGSFWSARLHHKAGCFREDLNYELDYEFWLRFRFIFKIKPFFIKQSVAIYRLHPHSKTMAQSTAFWAETENVRAEYQRFLNHRQRVWLRITRRHRKARIHGSTAVSMIKKKNLRAAIKQLFAAFRAWPLIVFDFVGVVLAIKAFGSRNNSDTVFPNLEPTRSCLENIVGKIPDNSCNTLKK